MYIYNAGVCVCLPQKSFRPRDIVMTNNEIWSLNMIIRMVMNEDENDEDVDDDDGGGDEKDDDDVD